MKTGVKRPNEGSSNSEPLSKRQRATAPESEAEGDTSTTKLEIENDNMNLGVEDDLYVLRYSSEPRTATSYEQIGDAVKMTIPEFNAALAKYTGKDEEIREIIQFVQACVMTAHEREMAQEKLNIAFSGADFRHVAPFFTGLKPYVKFEHAAGFKECPTHPMRMSEQLFEKVLNHMDSAFNLYGYPWQHENEAMRNHCLAEVFLPVLDVFKGVFIDEAEMLLESGVSKKRGRVEHRWTAFESICAVYQEVKIGESKGPAKLKVLAQMMLEAEACSFENQTRGFCIPVIGILAAYDYIQVLIYHPHTRNFYLSGELPGLSPHPSKIGTLILQIRRTADIVFGLLTCAYVNALDAFLALSERRAKKDNTKRESTAHWHKASQSAKQALGLGRKAARTIVFSEGQEFSEEGREEAIREALRLSEEAVQFLEQSVQDSPRTREMESLLEYYLLHKKEVHKAEAAQVD